MSPNSWDSSISDLPEAYLDRLPEILDEDDLGIYADHVASQRPLTIRVADDSLELSEVEAAITSGGMACHRCDWMPGSLWITPSDRELFNEIDLSRDSRIFRQSLSSMAAVQSLGVGPGDDVLDCCAAPGGKSSLIRLHQQSRGILVANDLSRNRVSRMRRLFELLGVDGIDTQVHDAKTLGSVFPTCFDRVLLDAPCSGEGRFNLHEPATWADWNRPSSSCSASLTSRSRTSASSACNFTLFWAAVHEEKLHLHLFSHALCSLALGLKLNLNL